MAGKKRGCELLFLHTKECVEKGSEYICAHINLCKRRERGEIICQLAAQINKNVSTLGILHKYR